MKHTLQKASLPGAYPDTIPGPTSRFPSQPCVSTCAVLYAKDCTHAAQNLGQSRAHGCKLPRACLSCTCAHRQQLFAPSQPQPRSPLFVSFCMRGMYLQWMRMRKGPSPPATFTLALVRRNDPVATDHTKPH
eukprot:23878-Chlamydomonas_euryale.AAC.6